MDVSYWATIGQTFDEIRAGARFVADAGWRGVWVPDHFMPAADPGNGPGPTGAELEPMLEGWVTLGALATSVERVRLGLMVGGNTYRHPAVVAKMALTLDNISGGRAVLGIGAGWQRNEHERYGIDLPSVKNRSDRLEEAVELCRVMFGAAPGERVDFVGEHYRLTQAPVAPGPVHGHLPILVGGAGAKRTLRTVARHADEWNAWGRPETIAGHLETLRAHCDAEGRSFDELHITAVGLLIIVDDAEAGAKLRESLTHRSGLVGTVDELKAVMEGYEEVGVHEVIVPDFAIVGPDKLRVLERFHTEVLDG
ncbi:MAG: LLM class flavin-dependent oxidoreductase [Actinomycetota bacterium]